MIRKKPAPHLDSGVGAGFPSGQTRSACPEIMLNQKDRAGDDSRKSHPVVVRLARQRDAAPKRASIARRVLIASLSVSISTSLQHTTAPWAMSFFSFTRCARPIGSAPAARLAAAGISLPHTV